MKHIFPVINDETDEIVYLESNHVIDLKVEERLFRLSADSSFEEFVHFVSDRHKAVVLTEEEIQELLEN